jgi:hypothetical protein
MIGTTRKGLYNAKVKRFQRKSAKDKEFNAETQREKGGEQSVAMTLFLPFFASVFSRVVMYHA